MQGSFASQATQEHPSNGKVDIHALPVKKLFEQLKSNEQGLTSEEAHKRLDKYGPNDTTGVKRISAVVQFLRLFLNPLVAILLFAGLISVILGDRINASIIIAIVVLSNILNFVQTYQSQNAVEKLRANVSPTATVLRDGTWVELPRRDLVPGDIILLEQSLQVLHNGILEGRKAFGNVIKYLLMGTSSNFGNMFSMAGAYVFLPFLPMLPTQILLNTFLYDLSQVTIPTDNVDASYIKKPQRWDIGLFRNFMIIIGPISSIFDFLTFFILLRVFHAGDVLFHTGWFVESLATQTLVLFIIRTVGNPLRSRPSRPLTITTLLIVALGILLPYSPLAGPLGFVPLPPLYFLFLTGMMVSYLFLVELVKRRLMRRYA